MNNPSTALLQKHFDIALDAPDGIKKLRELILTLAMEIMNLSNSAVIRYY